jgi:hypothetical protein
MAVVTRPVKVGQEVQHIITSVLTLRILELDNVRSFMS